MDSLKASASNIKVFCRFRPFNKQQIENKAQKIHRISNAKQLIIKDPNRADQISFMFDTVFDVDSTQQQIYQNIGSPILSNILDGFNGTIMAYGQTSSGKTHTMQGHDINDRDHKGLIPRIIENLFTSIEKSAETLQFKLKVSIFQLYMEKIRDLLDVSKTDLKIRQNKNQGPYVQNLTEAYISDKIQLYKLIHLGQKNRATCMTNMNALSSRSHMIFLLTLSQFNSETSQAKASKLFLIDLAGSQKVSKTGAQGKVLQQAKKINLSLTSLGMVIKSLSQGQAHVPYRDSKLTRIIKDSLGGNSKTTLIVTCSPHEMHVSETISTLRFGQNAQKIKNKPKINRQLTVPELQKMIQQLQTRIEQKDEWIKILENYIKTQLNAPLPKNQKKLTLNKNIQQQNQPEQPQTTSIIQQQQILPPRTHLRKHSKSLQIQSIQKLQPQKAVQQQSEQNQNASQDNILSSDSLIKNSIQIQTSNIYEPNFKIIPIQNQQETLENTYNYQHIVSLEAELESYKQNLQSQLNKFYQLKKQYNSLNQNLKGLIEQNINYQQKQKQYEQRLIQQKQQIINKYRKNCGLIFGQILDSSNLCSTGRLSKSCYDTISGIIDNKGENINFFDYWKSQKQTINKKMQQVIDKSLTMQKKLDKKQQTSQQEQYKKQEQNRKIIQMQQKLDSLYLQYQQMLTLQTNWKVQCQLYERKLKIKQQKITQLRNMLQEIQQQMQMMAEQNDQTMSVNTKIIKPLKGGFLFR